MAAVGPLFVADPSGAVGPLEADPCPLPYWSWTVPSLAVAVPSFPVRPLAVVVPPWVVDPLAVLLPWAVGPSVVVDPWEPLPLTTVVASSPVGELRQIDQRG